MMPQTRISKDVWQLGEEIAAARGLGTPRQAIEAVVRVYARHYLQGSQPVDPPAAPPAVQPTASAQDALSSVLSSL
ncbi:hypothetical protein [Leptolyngbya sp. FACHB-711]|uniref:hypothetical protein n=1 Tax=Leptolyngbya sp. FACHB-711 TaxID=2692813 RepID=UPI001683C269|nr:hypothetical protein [Leptolyngbya sp. FACHB-711]MBD2025249.1 hypothetical protein [Leptolyngbya sp. FACHB-711]